MWKKVEKEEEQIKVNLDGVLLEFCIVETNQGMIKSGPPFTNWRITTATILIPALREGWDEQWLETALEYDPDLVPVNWLAEAFLNDVCGQFSFNKLLYNKTVHHEIIPQLITLAGVLDAVPLDVESGLDQISSWLDHQVQRWKLDTNRYLLHKELKEMGFF